MDYIDIIDRDWGHLFVGHEAFWIEALAHQKIKNKMHEHQRDQYTI